jgi:PAS domain S-box-containing protein
MSGQGPKTIAKKIKRPKATPKTVLTTTIPTPASLDAFTIIEQGSLDAIPTGFCVCKADTSLVRYNKHAVELWGRELPLGEPTAHYSGTLRRYRADGQPLRFDSTPVAQAMRSGERVVSAEIVIEQPDGSRVPVLMNVQPLKDPSGRVEGAVCSFQELTERKRAEEALRASEAELQSVINRTPFMLVRCGHDLRYRFVSEAYAHMLGQKRDEILGKTIGDILGDKGLKTLRPYTERVLRGEAVNFECNLDFPNIGTRRLHIAYRPELDAKGKAGGWIASLLDVTEQRRAEAAIARRADEQAALYRFTDRLYRAASLNDIYEATLDTIVAALHCSRASIQRVDTDGVMRFAAWRGLSDCYRAAIEGHSPWKSGAANPEPVCVTDINHANFGPAIKNVAVQEGIGALIFVPLMAGGSLVGKFVTYYEAPREFAQEDVELTLTLARQLGFGIERMRADHARTRIEAELRKLSERLEAEVQKRTLERDRIWNVSEDLLGVSNFEGYFLSMNPAWTRLLGWSEDEIKAMNVRELRHPDDAAHSIASREQLAQGASTVRMENRFRHKDGSWRWLQWTMTESSGLIYIAGRHVTVEKEAAVALERAQRQTAHLQKMDAIGQLTGGIAHDFNNLLMIVSGHAQRLKNRLTEARDQRALAAIEMAATRGENLTRQLLSFARTLPLSPMVISPAETVHAIRDVLAGSLHVNIDFRIEAPDGTWPVRVDKSELELALVNLAVNARDAMPDGGHIVISAKNARLASGDLPEDFSGDFVALSVADTGKGIPPDLLSRVVEPFFTTKSPDKGTGLGLSQVYGFARRSNGTVSIDSEPGRGTKVTIYLPRSHAAIAAPLPQDDGHYIAAGRQTVLVVEDNADVRNVAISLLEELGYRTIEAETAAAALDALASEQDVGIVFSDVVLPGQIDGLALARTVSTKYPRIPVVLTTGYTKVFETDPEFPVLRKPYQIAALGRVIHDALEASRAQRPMLAI